MIQSRKAISVSGMIISLVVLLNAVILKAAFTGTGAWYWALLISVPLLLIAIRDVFQKKHAIIRNYPVIGHLRYFFRIHTAGNKAIFF